MWSWLTENSAAIQAAVGVLTLLVWLFYAQLLYSSFRRSRRSEILITVGGGDHLDSECIVTNMSKEPIYLDSIVVTLHDEGEEHVQSLSRLGMDRSRDDLRGKVMQGTLGNGEMISLGPFRHLLSRAERSGRKGEPLSFSLTAIAVYTAAQRVVAAKRDFTLRGETLSAESASARQIRSFWHRSSLNRLRGKAGDGEGAAS